MTAQIQPGSSRWNQLIELGRQAQGRVTGDQWFLGDAALEIAPMGVAHSNTGAYANLRRYADEIGVAFGTIRDWRRVASAWKPARRAPGVPWSIFAIFATRPELLDEALAEHGGKLLHQQAREFLADHTPVDEQATRPKPPAFTPGQLTRAIQADFKIREAARAALMAADVAREAREADLEAQIIANGGRVPTREEIEDREEGLVVRAVAGAIEDGYEEEKRKGAADDLFVELEAAVRRVTDRAPWPKNSPEAQRLTAIAWRLMDAIEQTQITNVSEGMER